MEREEIELRLHRLAVARLAVLFVFIVVALVLIVGAASAAEVFRSQRSDGSPVVLRLSDKPCTNAKVLGHLHDRLLDDRRFNAAVLTYGGEDWASCWVEREGVVISIDEEGSPLQPVPRGRFQQDGI